MRAFPSRLLVVDTNIVLSSALSRKEDSINRLRSVLDKRVVLISDQSCMEGLRVCRALAHEHPDAPTSFEALLELFEIRIGATYATYMDSAAETLRLAVPSRNGSTSDDHVLALAWAAEADIWSADRNFAGTGWPSWSTANLVRALADEPIPSPPGADDPA